MCRHLLPDVVCYVGYTWLLKMIVGVLTACHTQYT
jgi:hypothetical protein